MPGRWREDLFVSVKREVLVGFIPTTVVILRSLGLCPLHSVVREEKVGGKCTEKIL